MQEPLVILVLQAIQEIQVITEQPATAVLVVQLAIPVMPELLVMQETMEPVVQVEQAATQAILA
jgi:hypothetical protein